MLRDVKGLGMNFQVGSWEVSTWESVFLCCVCVAVVVSSEASGVCVSVLREIGNWKLVGIFCLVLWNCQMCFWKLANVLHKDFGKVMQSGQHVMKIENNIVFKGQNNRFI